MITNIEIRKPTARDIRLLVQNMRQSDMDELKAYFNNDYEYIVKTSVKYSKDAWAVVVNGKLLFICGVGLVSLIGRVGCPWLLGTNDIAQYPKEFYKQTKTILAEVLQDYDKLQNHVYFKNTQSMQFLKRLGFDVKSPEQYGANGEMFHPFEMVAV